MMTEIYICFGRIWLAALIAFVASGACDSELPFSRASQAAILTEKQGREPLQRRAATDEEVMHLAAAAEKLRAGMVLLIAPDGESSATGFVISRKHRLVVTAGHVADDILVDRVSVGRWKIFRDGTISTLLRRPCMVSSASRAHSERLCAFAVAITPRRPSRIRAL